MRLIQYFFLFFIMLILLPNAEAASGSAAEGNKRYLFGIVPQQSASRLANNWLPLLKEISAKTGLNIEFTTAKDIPTFERCLSRGAYEFSYMNPYHYTVFHKNPGYRAFAHQRGLKLKGILVVRNDSILKSHYELRGAKLAFPSPAAFGASVLPQAGARRIADGELGHQITVTGRDELAETAISFNSMSHSLVALASKLDNARIQAEERRQVAETILQDAISSLSEGLIIISSTGIVLQINTVFEKLHGMSTSTRRLQNVTDVEAVMVHNIERSFRGVATIEQLLDPAVIPINNVGTWLSNAQNGEQWTIHYSNGSILLYSASKMANDGMVIIVSDFSKSYRAEVNARRLERELLQSQKLKAIGTLSGGIAHELNTPIQFIGDNLTFISTASDELLNIVDQHRKLLNAIKQDYTISEIAYKASLTMDATDIDFMKDEIPLALKQSKDGVSQMVKIIQAMKEFSHPSQKEKDRVDINDALERAVIIGRTSWKFVAEIDWDLQIPPPIAFGNESELNQVFLNLLINAADAILSARREHGRIAISTRSIADKIQITISDNGCGIPKEIQHRVFEQFFTTKDVGKGTGQGLAICHEIITSQNGGRLHYHSKKGVGTTFHIELPIAVNAQPSV